jgi:hypothetical protein
MLRSNYLLLKNLKTINFLKFNIRAFRNKAVSDRENFWDNRIRTGIEVSPYNPQFTLTEEEKKGMVI